MKTLNDNWHDQTIEEAILYRTQEVYELVELGELELDISAEEFLYETMDRKGL